MLYRNCTLDELEDAARRAGVRLVGVQPVGRGLRATLGLLPPPADRDGAVRWQRRSASPSRRKVAAVCWHGHAVFMLYLYLRNPNVRITGGRETSVDYQGAAHFLATFRSTGLWNIGSDYHPVYYADACTCPRSLVTEVSDLERHLQRQPSGA